LLELTSDRCTVIEQRRSVVASEPSRVRNWLRCQPLEMPALDEEDVIDQLANRRETAARLYCHLECRRVLAEPASPFFALAVRVPHQFVEGDRQRHRYFITSDASTTFSGPRFSAAIPGSIVFLSPTITTANFSG
jgi:hypothetical protein